MVRFAIAGFGNMGTGHARTLLEGRIPDAVLAAVCDIRPPRLEAAAEMAPSVARHDSLDTMLSAGGFDVLLVAVPHPLHPDFCIRGFRAGYHVLCEKPAGIDVRSVREMNRVARDSGRVFAIMYNQRTNPVYRKVRDMIRGGELGGLKRVVWAMTDWYRPQSYHDSSEWRSTWKGEGGGVLVNQCPHQLDLWQWIFGLPDRVRAVCHEGRYHDIEVEDDVTAYFEYRDGPTGTFLTSTGETPGENRLVVTGDLGRLDVTFDAIVFRRNRVPERVFEATNRVPFGAPEFETIRIDVPSGGGPQHAGVLSNVTDAILGRAPLEFPGEEGIRGLTLSNSIHLSSWTDGWVSPSSLDEDLFLDLLGRKIAASRPKRTLREQVADTRGTY